MKWLRKRISWIAALAVGGMVFWLVFSATTLQHAQENAAGALFGQPVPAQEYRKALGAVTHDAALRFGDRYRQQIPDAQLEQQAWERLILVTEARRIGIRVSDREVIEEIRKIPLFQTRDGQFDPPGYENVMRYSLGTTSRAYEEETRDGLAIRKLFDRAVGNPTLTEQEILEEFERRKKLPKSEEIQLESVRAEIEKELLDQKRLRAYFTWYQDLLQRANPKEREQVTE